MFIKLENKSCMILYYLIKGFINTVDDFRSEDYLSIYKNIYLIYKLNSNEKFKAKYIVCWLKALFLIEKDLSIKVYALIKQQLKNKQNYFVDLDGLFDLLLDILDLINKMNNSNEQQQLMSNALKFIFSVIEFLDEQNQPIIKSMIELQYQYNCVKLAQYIDLNEVILNSVFD